MTFLTVSYHGGLVPGRVPQSRSVYGFSLSLFQGVTSSRALLFLPHAVWRTPPPDWVSFFIRPCIVNHAD